MSKSPKEILQQYWGFSEFRGSQEKIISAILLKQDVLALLPTGGGKSVCFQVPALVKEGICIVISPLISLIQNQVDALKEKGIKAIALTGGIPFDEVNNLLDNCMFGGYKFLYLSPERLQQDIVQERIQKMNVNLIAIDEAHCISHWGHDFRPAYLECSKLRGILPDVPMIALTATATKQVTTDIIDDLKFIEPLVVKDSFCRENIAFKIFREEDKRYRVKLLCSKLIKSAIVYVRTRRLAQEVAQYLNANGSSATHFHGGISKQEKEKKLNQWLKNEIKVMVATNAFGMGIDKPDVELVVHYQIPDSIENYFQEAGRAGRDGNIAEAVLITNKTDEELVKKQFLSVLPDTAFLKLVYNKLNNYFQIAYGEGKDEKFQLNFNEFCSTYSLNPLLAYNTMQILDQNSVIALNESFSKKSTVQFVASKESLFDYFENNQNIVLAAQTILRTYGGIFDFDTKINVRMISKKAKTSETYIIKVLEQLKSDGLINYTAHHSDLDITFLVPREDDLTINVFAGKVKERHRIKEDNLDYMLAYITNNKLCRSRQLLKYFGEEAKDNCGICDICTDAGDSNETTLELISEEVFLMLKSDALTSRELIEKLTYKESDVLLVLRRLLEDEFIQINTKNQYELE
ncbi:RecQ family ATP-dependent DNA helicase [Maribacter algarum]|uniref:ATP-dependent DNA helicase RecQ n=1 Tax=Maribacter algarum (ex Zhang et al. 2020) TaxID=2578118 RepID=A0A5S3PSD6_9FLAO|nr:RecQ family ATP-dependent DNA helicase [Maribacter algarum]TMM57549.1 RecQ family ATP-dependent DNA helicase [Maribacter algarum]